MKKSKVNPESSSGQNDNTIIMINPKHEIRNSKQIQSANDQNSFGITMSKQNEFWYLNLEFV